MSFEIRNVRTNEVLHPYTTISSAKRAFASRGLTPDTYYIADLEWKAREAARKDLINLEEFGLIAIPDHFLHKSTKSTDVELLVSFTESKIKGEKNLQASGRRVGKYLAEFYPTLSAQKVSDIGALITAKTMKLGVQFATTAKDIAELYQKSAGGSAEACMSKKVTSYSSRPHHPTEAYAGPDLAVAYMVDSYGTVTARGLCWPDKKRYGRLYGNAQNKLAAALQTAGYEHGYLTGARMTKIELVGLSSSNTKAYVCPYIDLDRYVHHTKDYLVIGRNPAASGANTLETSTTGYVSFQFYINALTGEPMDNSRQRVNIVDPRTGARLYLNRTEADQHCWIDHHNGHYYLKTGREADYEAAGDGLMYPYWYIMNYMHQCVVTKKRFQVSDMFATDNGYVSHAAYMTKYAVCDWNRVSYLRTDMVWMEHQVWWHRHTFQNHGLVVDGKNYAKALLEQKAA